MLQLLRLSPVVRIYAIEPREDTREVALRNGADIALDPSDLPSNLFFTEDSTGNHGVDVVVEASGSQSGLDLAARLVRPHGVISILGYHQGTRQIDMREWNWKALDVINAHVRDRHLLNEATTSGIQLQAAGVPHPVDIPEQEMYGEYFDIPQPEETVFLSTFSGGEVFRSGVTYTRGLGKVFYFSPGDQDYPVYYHPDVQQILANAVRWAAPTLTRADLIAEEAARPTNALAENSHLQ